MDELTFTSLEQHKTMKDGFQNGILTPLWKTEKGFVPEQVCVTTVDAKMVKGPYMHTMLNQRLALIEGKGVIAYRKRGDSKINEKMLNSPVLMTIPPNWEYALIAKTNLVLVNIRDKAWVEGDKERKDVLFEGCDFSKQL